MHVAIRAWHYLAPGVVLVAAWAGAEAVWWWVPPARGETVGEVAGAMGGADRPGGVGVRYGVGRARRGAGGGAGRDVGAVRRRFPRRRLIRSGACWRRALRCSMTRRGCGITSRRGSPWWAPGAGAHAVGRVWLPSRGETVGDVTRRTLARGWRAWSAFLTGAGVRRPLIIGTVGAIWWRFLPFPAPGADPVVGLLAGRSPLLYDAARLWHYLAPGIALVGSWAVMQGVGRVWV